METEESDIESSRNKLRRLGLNVCSVPLYRDIYRLCMWLNFCEGCVAQSSLFLNGHNGLDASWNSLKAMH